MSKGRGISADIQLPRTKLLYLIYQAPHSRIKAAPGVKSQICTALGYKSDGHFHHDWNYLLEAGMMEDKDGYFTITANGKKEFSMQSTASRTNQIVVGVGITLIVFTFLVELGVVPIEGAAIFGVVLVFLGGFFSILAQANKPDLPISARVLLKELRKLG
jgi:hypothetical protein